MLLTLIFREINKRKNEFHGVVGDGPVVVSSMTRWNNKNVVTPRQEMDSVKNLQLQRAKTPGVTWANVERTTWNARNAFK